MSQELTITIKANDGTSQTFKAIASNANAMATSLTKAGSSASGLSKIDSAASKSASSLAKLDSAAAKSESSLSKLESIAGKFDSTGAKIGGTLATIAGALSDFSHAAADSEVIQQRLEAAVNATGKSYADYAKQIDAAINKSMQLGFDDEDTANALSQMTATIGDAGQALQDLSIAQDLARGSGISLATAADVVGRVAAGNIGILSRYGIVVQQGATAQQALAQIQQRYAGQSEAYAGTVQASFDRMATAAGNFAEEVGGKIGGLAQPLQVVVGLLPGMSTGFTAAGAAIGGFSKSLAEGGKAATAMELATSTAGLAFGAFALAAGVGIAALVNYEQETKAAEEASKELKTAIQEVFATDTDTASLAQKLDFSSLANGHTFDGLNGVDTIIKNLKGEYTQYIVTAQDAAKADQEFAATLQDVAKGGHDAAQEFVYAIDRLQGDVRTQTETWTDAKAILDGLQQAYAYNDAGAAGLHATLDALNREYESGQIDVKQYSAAVHAITDNLPATEAYFAAAEASVKKFDDTVSHAYDDIEKLRASGGGANAVSPNTEMTAHELAVFQAIQRAKAEAAKNDAEYTAMEASRAQGLNDIVVLEGKAADSATLLTQKQMDLANSLTDALVPALQGAQGGFAEIVKPGEDVLDTLARIAPVSNDVNASFANLADGLNNAMQGMDGVLSLFKELDTIGKASSDAVKIAQDVVGDPGVYAKVDDLLQQGLITLSEYRGYQQNEVDIVKDDAAVQNDLNLVRAKSIPLLAQQENALRQYADSLAATAVVNPELAQQAVYLMDAGNQAKVASAYSTAYAASLGEIPSDVATDIIVSAAEADPILAGILESYGLIKVGADGTVSVNFPDKATLDDVRTSVDHLNNTLIHIAIAMGGDPTALDGDLVKIKQHSDDLDGAHPTITAQVTDNATPTLDDVKGGVETIDGTHATATVDVQDNATPKISQIQGEFAQLGNQKITIPVDVSIPDKPVSPIGVQYTAPAPVQQPKVADQTATTHLVADDQASSVIARVMQEASALNGQTYTAHISADSGDAARAIQTAIQEGQSFAGQTYSATLSAKSDGFSNVLAAAASGGQTFNGTTYTATLDAKDSSASVISGAQKAAQSFANGEYQASLIAKDSSGDVIAGAKKAAQDFANGEYQAQLNASDNASSIIQGAQNNAETFAIEYMATLTGNDQATAVITTAQTNAQNFANGEYQAQLLANDAASGVIATAQSAATAFASTYSADLECVDNASGVIASVSSALDAINGKTATTYINTVNTSDGGPMHAGGGRLGKVIQADIPHAATGRVIQVGESGPELALLPFGTMVVPHGAAAVRQKAEDAAANKPDQHRKVDLLPDIDMAKAYKKGQDSAAQYYKGVLDKMKSELQTLKSDDKVYANKGAARDAVNEQLGLQRGVDQARKKLDEARAYDKKATKDATDATTAVSDSMSTLPDSGYQAGQATGDAFQSGFSDSMSGGMDVSGVLSQVMQLKDQLMSSLKGGANGVGDMSSAVDDFNNQVAQLVSGLSGMAKTSDKTTEQVGNDFQQLSDTADKSGQDAGQALGTGLQDGLDSSGATDTVSGLQDQMNTLASGDYTPKVAADDSQATQAIQQTGTQLGQLDGQSATVTIKVDDAAWQNFKSDVSSADLTATVHSKTDKSGSGGGGNSGSGSSGSGKRLGGGIHPSLVPHAAFGRVVQVGEAGAENVILPFGSMVLPHAASRRGSGTAQYVFNGPVHFHVATPELGQAIQRQMTSVNRGQR